MSEVFRCALIIFMFQVYVLWIFLKWSCEYLLEYWSYMQNYKDKITKICELLTSKMYLEKFNPK